MFDLENRKVVELESSEIRGVVHVNKLSVTEIVDTADDITVAVKNGLYSPSGEVNGTLPVYMDLEVNGTLKYHSPELGISGQINATNESKIAEMMGTIFSACMESIARSYSEEIHEKTGPDPLPMAILEEMLNIACDKYSFDDKVRGKLMEVAKAEMS